MTKINTAPQWVHEQMKEEISKLKQSLESDLLDDDCAIIYLDTYEFELVAKAIRTTRKSLRSEINKILKRRDCTLCVYDRGEWLSNQDKEHLVKMVFKQSRR